MADGALHSMAMIAESTYGTTPATPTWTNIRHTGTTLGMSKDTFQSEEVRSDRQIADFRHGAKQTGGEISIELSYSTFDAILEALLGGTWATDTPSIGTDQLKAGTTRRSFTVERYFSDLLTADKPYHRYTGCEFDTLALQINANAMVTGTIGLIGQGLTTDTVEVPSSTYSAATTTSPLDSFTGTINEGGSSIAVITEMQLNLENGLGARFVVGSDETIRPSIGRSNVSGQVTAFFENATLLDKFINETESDIDFTLTDGATNSYKFILPRIKYNGAQPDVQGDGPITIALPFQALYDSTDATNLTIERTPV